jgi:DNA-binding XRE family transcriptional regulator
MPTKPTRSTKRVRRARVKQPKLPKAEEVAKIVGVSKTLGQTIRELREQKGMSLRALAKVVGVSAPFLCDVEWDRRKTDRLEPLAVALGVPVTTLRALDNRVTSDLKVWLEQNPAMLAVLRKAQVAGTVPDVLLGGNKSCRKSS